MMRRSRRIRLGKRSLTGVDVEGGEDRGVEVEVVVVVDSGVGGEGVVGEVSRERMQTQRKCQDVIQTALVEGPKSAGKGFPKSSFGPLLTKMTAH